MKTVDIYTKTLSGLTKKELIILKKIYLQNTKTDKLHFVALAKSVNVSNHNLNKILEVVDEHLLDNDGFSLECFKVSLKLVFLVVEFGDFYLDKLSQVTRMLFVEQDYLNLTDHIIDFVESKGDLVIEQFLLKNKNGLVDEIDYLDCIRFYETDKEIKTEIWNTSISRNKNNYKKLNLYRFFICFLFVDLQKYQRVSLAEILDDIAVIDFVVEEIVKSLCRGSKGVVDCCVLIEIFENSLDQKKYELLFDFCSRISTNNKDILSTFSSLQVKQKDVIQALQVVNPNNKPMDFNQFVAFIGLLINFDSHYEAELELLIGSVTTGHLDSTRSKRQPLNDHESQMNNLNIQLKSIHLEITSVMERKQKTENDIRALEKEINILKIEEANRLGQLQTLAEQNYANYRKIDYYNAKSLELKNDINKLDLFAKNHIIHKVPDGNNALYDPFSVTEKNSTRNNVPVYPDNRSTSDILQQENYSIPHQKMTSSFENNTQRLKNNKQLFIKMLDSLEFIGNVSYSDDETIFIDSIDIQKAKEKINNISNKMPKETKSFPQHNQNEREEKLDLNDNIKLLMAMGFSANDSKRALFLNDGDINAAINHLL